ncbi:MAG: tetratricopeptide repeat protein [Burkholderiales bacterium]|nr:tetratricopeptide repeat protein [Burkholderiales bacterium]
MTARSPVLAKIPYWLIGCALAASTAFAPPAFPQAPKTHDAAVAALHDADPDRRLQGVVWIAEHGAFDDAELLHKRLRDEEPVLRHVAEQGLWMLWSRSGDAETDRLLAGGTEIMQRGAYAEAIDVFSMVIARAPEFAEGWNKRATAYFLAGEYRKSIADCEEVFKRNPKHFGALSGNGQNWLALGELETARGYLKRALEVNPNLDGVAEMIRKIDAFEQNGKGRSI